MSEERLTRLEVKVDHTDRELKKLTENINRLVDQLGKNYEKLTELSAKDQQFIVRLEMVSAELSVKHESLLKEVKANREQIERLNREKNYFTRLVLTFVFTAVLSLVVVKTKLFAGS